MRVIECLEHEYISFPVESLIVDGRIALDPRIAERGYLDVSISGGRVGLRTTRFVGLIPLAPGVAIRVTPKIPNTVLSELIIRAENVPNIIVDFSRGYLPRFEIPIDARPIFIRSMLRGLTTVVNRGLMKRYITIEDPPPWRGKLCISQTIVRQRAKGIKFRAHFDYTTLSHNVIENVALKEAVLACVAFETKDKGTRKDIAELMAFKAAFEQIPRWEGRLSSLLSALAARASYVPANYLYYQSPLWMAYSILQGQVPAPESVGYAHLDSLIVDVASAFESFVRKTLSRGIETYGWRVTDGNLRPSPLFTTTDRYLVHPDVIVEHATGSPLVIEVKYKVRPTEADRYELLAFMEALDADIGVFVCPGVGAEEGITFTGRTAGGKRIYTLRVRIDQHDFDSVEYRLRAEIAMLVEETG